MQDGLFNIWNAMSGVIRACLLVVAVVVALGIVGLIGFRVCCVNKVENYEFAYRWDLSEQGKITPITRIEDGKVVSRSGYVVTWPIITKVHTIDLRPMQVCISAIQRVLNCKLVQFDPKGFDLFISWHGRGDYMNGDSSRREATIFNQTLMAYAYEGSGKSYPFLRIIRELRAEEVQEQQR